MHITIENNRVIVHLDSAEVPAFQAMFARIQDDIGVAVEFRDFNGADFSTTKMLLPLHLCRVIGEANLSENPFATMSIYPFWKYGFAFGGEGKLALELGIDDPHKKAVAADEFGMGFCCWAMEEVFDCEFWAESAHADGRLASTLRDSAEYNFSEANPTKSVERVSSGLAGLRRRARPALRVTLRSVRANSRRRR